MVNRAAALWRRWGPWVLLALLAAGLAPILLLGRYDWASLDDYCYAIWTHDALMAGSGFWGAVWRTMWGYYDSWQGTFMALGMMSLTPLAFSEFAYWVTPWVMIGSLGLGTFKLADTLIRRWLGGTWRQVVFVAAPVLLLSVQCAPYARESFYWWNGAVYYTFTYGVVLLLADRLAALALAETRRQRLWALVPALPMAVLIGGSNYVSALLSLLLCGLFLLAFLIWERKKLPFALPVALVLAAAFLVSFLAPGNGGRQSSVGEPLGLVRTVWRSILQAGKDCLTWPNVPMVLAALLLIPAVWGLTTGISFRFPLPLGFSVCSFLLFAAQNAPHLYAVSTAGPGRLRSIVYYSFYWLVLCNLWYWLGWLRRAVLPRIRDRARAERAGWTAAGVVLALLILTAWPLGWVKNLNAYQAACALADGSARAYWQEQRERLELLQDPAAADVALPPIQVRPPLLFTEDITEDPADWRNNTMRMFYHKNSITLKN